MEKTKYLSFKYVWKFSKRIEIISNIFLTVIILISLTLISTVEFYNLTQQNRIFGIIFLSIILFYGISRLYLLILSKTVKYDENFLFVKQNSEWIKVPIIYVSDIKRYFNKFCTIYFKENEFYRKDKLFFRISSQFFPWKTEKSTEVIELSIRARESAKI